MRLEQTPHAPAVAAHRFGLGEADLAVVGDEAPAWLLGQIGPGDAAVGEALPGIAEALRVQQQARRSRDPGADLALRNQTQADLRSRLLTAVSTRRPFAERLVWFWSNHFTVSLAKGACQGLVGAHEREAIRPHIAGRFEDLLWAAVTHPTMLRYLDNQLSAGPQSPLVQRLQRRGGPAAQRRSGLNENLAREVLELHTLGVSGGGGLYGPWGGYSQTDVTSLALVLTGWRGLGSDAEAQSTQAFDAAWHQPGAKTVLGRRHEAGPEALQEVLRGLARHPCTARHVCTKLARHFVADDPPLPLVQRLAAVWLASDGDLAAVYRTLIEAPEAWQPTPAKLRTPEDYVVATLRLVDAARPARSAQRLRAGDLGLAAMGQRPQSAPSPAGWPDQASEWLGPEALWQRLEWAQRLAERQGDAIDARRLAQASLGPRLGDDSRRQIERAADGRQALVLLLMAPEFQRR